MTTLELVVTALTGGGVFGGIVALVKMRPEANRITIDAAEGAVVVQTKVITDLRSEIDRLKQDMIEERQDCDRKIAMQQAEIDSLKKAFKAIDERQTQRRYRE